MLKFLAVVRPPFLQRTQSIDFILISYFSQFFGKILKTEKINLCYKNIDLLFDEIFKIL
jgi:hypothetical protein